MVGRDVQEHGDVGAEVIHVVQLEGGKFDDVVLVRCFCHLQCEAVADVSGESDVHPRFPADVIDERSGGGFAVASRDANHAGIGEACGIFNFADDGNVSFAQFHNHRCRGRNAGAFDDFVGIEDFGFGVTALFPCDGVVVEERLVARLNWSHVGDEHVAALATCEDGGTHAALGGSQDN